MRIFLQVLCVCASVGCTFRGFQPPPEEFERWHKKGVDFIEVQKALLECGLPTPWGDLGFSREASELNARVFACMENDGFVEKNDPGFFCRNVKDLFYCQPENKKSAPKRDVNLRLNGKYCTYKSSYKGADGKSIPIDYSIEAPSCHR